MTFVTDGDLSPIIYVHSLIELFILRYSGGEPPTTFQIIRIRVTPSQLSGEPLSRECNGPGQKPLDLIKRPEHGLAYTQLLHSTAQEQSSDIKDK